MQEITVKPLESVLNVKLGETKENVIKIIGQPSASFEQTDHYQNQTPMFSIDYDKNQKVEYINISNPNSKNIKVSFKQIDLFNSVAREVISKLEKHNLTPDPKDPEFGYSFIFLNNELSLWRPTQPEAECDEDGKYFECIGIGIKGYYSNGY